MKFNKTLAAALLLGVTLTGCDNVVEKDDANEANAPTVEENTANEEATETTDDNAETTDADTDAEETLEETDEESEDDADTTDATDESEEDAADEEAETATTTDTSDMSVEEKRQVLEQAIFDNRSQARAAELLLELTPDKVADITPQLHQLIDESNALLEKAQQALDQLGE